MSVRQLAILFGFLLTIAIPHASYAEGQFIDIAARSVEDIKLVLDTLESSLDSGGQDLPAIVLMLHGPEAHRFVRKNYSANKALIDQTAKLAAYEIIKVQICAAWMAENNYETDALFPFVSTVPFGAGELERLAQEEGYTEFSVNI